MPIQLLEAMLSETILLFELKAMLQNVQQTYTNYHA